MIGIEHLRDCNMPGIAHDAADEIERLEAALGAAEIEAARLRLTLLDAVLVIEDFLPNIGQCALQNYERLNTVLIESTPLIRELRKEIKP